MEYSVRGQYIYYTLSVPLEMVRALVKEGETKLTITLSQKAADTLEMLTESSGFGSRGRTIEEAVLVIDDLTRGADEMATFMRQFSEKQQKGQQVTLQESQTALFALLTYMVTYISALSRFRKPTWTHTVAKNLKTTASS